MKRTYYYIAVLFTLSAMYSCIDLDRFPLEELSDGSFWLTPNDAEMAVSELYTSLPYWDVDLAINSDDAVHGIKWAAGNISKGVYDPLDFGWSGDYTTIRKANLVFDKIDNIENYKEADKNKVLGQAHFFRAFTYFTLIRSYGDVPYTEKPLELSDQEGITRESKDVIFEKIMADFDKAISYLPIEWPASDYGRITKGGALAMKARAALYFSKWDIAAQSAKAVMDLGAYELYDKNNTGRYEELFWEVADGCDEFIIVREFKESENSWYLIGWEAFPTLGWGGINPTQSLVDAFEDIYGAPIAESQVYNEKTPFENRDPRLEVNVLHDGQVMYGETIKVAPLKSAYPTGIEQHGDATATGYYQRKWLDPSIHPSSAGWDMGKDAVILRYAEVLLTYAEAKNELSPLDAEAFAAVNEVRKRVGMPELQMTNPSLPTYCGTQDDLRQRIRNEWRVEFALEGGKRMWDIRRWGIAKDVLNAPFMGLKYKLVESPDAHPDDGGMVCVLYEGDNVILPGSKYEDHNYVYPIPQKEIDLNPNLKQNPGY